MDGGLGENQRVKYFLIILGGLVLFVPGGCKEIPADRLFALHLERAPAAADWERALPRLVTVKGGRVHKVDPLPDIDEDTVHTTTASCHHGASLPPPLEVDLRAFYTDRDLYLRVSWLDATRDQAMRQWRFDGTAWQSSAGLEDGFGLLWAPSAAYGHFTCSYACHISDFGVSGASFHASNKMKLAQAGSALDLWNWKAQRTGRFGFADDRYLDVNGMQGDTPGELFAENSRFRLEPETGRVPFAEGDAPIYDDEGLPVGKEFRPAGSTAPGYLTERPVGGRADVTAVSDYRDGHWIVILRRALDSGDSHDLRFIPGDADGVAFGLSIMDDTLKEHYASVSEERLVLLPLQRD